MKSTILSYLLCVIVVVFTIQCGVSDGVNIHHNSGDHGGGGGVIDSEATSKHLLSRLRRQSERDPYIFNLFEVLLTTLETKLRRVENLDRAIEHLSRRLESVEEHMLTTLNTTAKIAHLLEVRFNNSTLRDCKQIIKIEKSEIGPSNRSKSNQQDGSRRDFKSSPVTVTIMEDKLEKVAEQVAVIDSKLSNLQQQLDTNSLSVTPQDELETAASETYRVGLGASARLQALDKRDGGFNILKTVMNNVHDSVTDMDRKLQFRMARLDDSIHQMNRDVREIKGSVVGDQKGEGQNPFSANTSRSGIRSKLDSIVDKISPLESAWDKMNEVWDVVVGTKNSVDVLVPKSDTLITTSVRQERAISSIHSDLTEKTNRIMQNIAQVERRIKQFPSEEKTPETKSSIDPVKLLRHTTNKDDKSTEPPADIIVEQPVTNNASRAALFTRQAGLTFVSSSSMDNSSRSYSCSDLLRKGETKSGIYYLKIKGTTYWLLQVYCDMTTAGGGWTVIQRRDDIKEQRENFNRNWVDYKHGFGTPEKEFWLGNENIFMLTNNQKYILRVELEDFDGDTRFAEYSTFKLHGEQDFYKLEIGGYSGDAGDSLNDAWYGSNLSPFSTYDKDNDRSSLNCASMLKGGWWWRSCGRGLNGLYLTNPTDFTARQGIVWFRWRGWDYTLKKSVLMIRPADHPSDQTKTPEPNKQ